MTKPLLTKRLTLANANALHHSSFGFLSSLGISSFVIRHFPLGAILLRWIKKLLWLSVAGGIIAALVYGFMPKPIPVDTARVTKGSLSVTVNEDGKTRLRDRYLISAPLAGRLHRIKVRAGDPVVVPPVFEPPSASVASTVDDDATSQGSNGNGTGTSKSKPPQTL